MSKRDYDLMAQVAEVISNDRLDYENKVFAIEHIVTNWRIGYEVHEGF